MPPTDPAIILAYRHLYQHALRAVHFSAPARYTIRDRLRLAFRRGKPADLDVRRVRNTLQFLRGAARAGSLEKRVLRGLLMTWYWEARRRREATAAKKGLKSSARVGGGEDAREKERQVRRREYDMFGFLVRMLNESMGLCIR